MKLNKIFALMLGAAVMFACNNTPTPEPEPEPTPEEDKLVLEDGTIVLNRCAGGIYFGNFWDEGIADYYFLLTNDEHIGQTAQGFDVPATPGRTLLYIDLWGALSEDHRNPIVPEGTYRWGDRRGENVLTSEFTLATQNLEQVGEQFRIVDRYFTDGTVVVEHTAKGYKIAANFITTEGEEMKFIFEGEMTLEDKSDDEEYNPELDGDVTVEPVIGSSYLFNDNGEVANHVLMLFSSEVLSDDKIHVGEPGMKLHLDLYNNSGKGIAGHYVAGELNEVGMIFEEPGVFYPGRMYGASMAFGSFLEVITEDMEVEYAVLEDGEVTITENGDGTYSVVGEFISGNEGTISCNWTGVVVPHL